MQVDSCCVNISVGVNYIFMCVLVYVSVSCVYLLVCICVGENLKNTKGVVNIVGGREIFVCLIFIRPMSCMSK